VSIVLNVYDHLGVGALVDPLLLLGHDFGFVIGEVVLVRSGFIHEFFIDTECRLDHSFELGLVRFIHRCIVRMTREYTGRNMNFILTFSFT